jgi:hypothetical protein
VRFKIRGWVAYDGVEDGFFTRNEDMIIALLPLVFLGITITVLSSLVTKGGDALASWYGILLVIQGQHIAEALGDDQVHGILFKQKKMVLANDDGMRMCYYLPENEQINAIQTENLSDLFRNSSHFI